MYMFFFNAQSREMCILREFIQMMTIWKKKKKKKTGDAIFQGHAFPYKGRNQKIIIFFSISPSYPTP